MSNHDGYEDGFNGDDLSGIFDHLSPDDFAITSAVDESARTNRGAAAFNSFVDEQLRAIRLAYTAAEGEINPIAILASPESQRLFKPDDDENMNEYVARLNREAKAMGATWVFISRKTLVASHMVDPDDVHDVNDEEAVADAIKKGLLKTGLVWFAERREGDERHRRHGVIEAGPNHQLGLPTEGSEGQPIPIFDRILA